jgi:hypothetical protein
MLICYIGTLQKVVIKDKNKIQTYVPGNHEKDVHHEEGPKP